tara:strand:- start:249 stop:947 length:699 start_codon:yes stop_codon:yes gene_type:complete
MVSCISQSATTKFVLYLRISTAKSGGVDSNGIAAQQRDLNLYLSTQTNAEVIGTFTDVMSGAKSDRPELTKALDLCRKTGAYLLSQKVDRVSRDVEFWARLVKDKSLNFRIASLPNADNFQIHLFAAMAQQEREFISLRTRAALREWKAKNPNKKLGNPNIASINKNRKYKARQFVNGISNVIMPLRDRGMTYQQIANTLNDMKMTTPKGCKFYPSQVKNVISQTLVMETVA